MGQLAALLTIFGNLGADQVLVTDCIRSELFLWTIHEHANCLDSQRQSLCVTTPNWQSQGFGRIKEIKLRCVTWLLVMS
jgi:hypothetical protein